MSVLVAISSPARASGSNDLGHVADALRNDPVYVDEGAERAISESDAERVRAAIGDANTPIYIAVLPESVAETAGVDAAEVARRVSEAVDLAAPTVSSSATVFAPGAASFRRDVRASWPKLRSAAMMTRRRC